MSLENVVQLIGGQENINSYTHCLTRLRFNVKDVGLVDSEEISNQENVLGVQIKGHQVQVIMQGNIDQHYNQLKNILGKIEANDLKKENKNRGSAEQSFVDKLLNSLSSILTPAIPAIAGGGLLKALYFFLTSFGYLDGDSNGAFVLNMMSDAMFFYLPFLLAYTSAKEFKANTVLALSLAGILMYPNFMTLAADTDKIYLFNKIPILVANYKSSVIPIILSVWLMKKVHDVATNIVPDSLNIVFVPILTIAFSSLISLIFLAPLGFYLAEYVSVLLEKVMKLTPFISGFVVGFSRPFLVLTGMHHALTPISIQQLEMYGFSSLGASNLMSTLAQASAALAFWLFSTEEEDKKLGASTALTGYIGITEPILFGILVPNKHMFLITMIAGGLGGGIATALGGAAYGFVMPGVLSLAAYAGEGFRGIVIGIFITIATTLLLSYLYTRRNKK